MRVVGQLLLIPKVVVDREADYDAGNEELYSPELTFLRGSLDTVDVNRSIRIDVPLPIVSTQVRESMLKEQSKQDEVWGTYLKDLSEVVSFLELIEV